MIHLIDLVMMRLKTRQRPCFVLPGKTENQ